MPEPDEKMEATLLTNRKKKKTVKVGGHTVVSKGLMLDAFKEHLDYT